MAAKPEARIELTVDGETYTLDIKDFTGRDARDFRREVGQPLLQSFDPDHLDLDIIGGLLWLHRRKHGEHGLTLDDVLDSITLDSFTVVAADESGHVDPEA